MVCGKCFHIHFHCGHYLAKGVEEKMVYGLQDCEKKSHSAYVQKPLLAEIDIVDLCVSFQQMLYVVPFHVNTIFRTLTETFLLISLSNTSHQVSNHFNTLYKSCVLYAFV